MFGEIKSALSFTQPKQAAPSSQFHQMRQSVLKQYHLRKQQLQAFRTANSKYVNHSLAAKEQDLKLQRSKVKLMSATMKKRASMDLAILRVKNLHAGQHPIDSILKSYLCSILLEAHKNVKNASFKMAQEHQTLVQSLRFQNQVKNLESLDHLMHLCQQGQLPMLQISQIKRFGKGVKQGVKDAVLAWGAENSFREAECEIELIGIIRSKPYQKWHQAWNVQYQVEPNHEPFFPSLTKIFSRMDEIVDLNSEITQRALKKIQIQLTKQRQQRKNQSQSKQEIERLGKLNQMLSCSQLKIF